MKKIEAQSFRQIWGKTADLLCQCVVSLWRLWCTLTEDVPPIEQDNTLFICIQCHCQQSAWQPPQYALTQFLAWFFEKFLPYYTTLSLCFFFRKVGDSVTWIFPPTIISHLISASVRLRFTLNIVTSRGIESFLRFAECRDPNSQSVHTSLDARRVATCYAPFVANEQDCLFADSLEQWLSA